MKGYNFYRVQYTNRLGKTGYTEVVLIIVDQAVVVTTYPNPVTDRLQVKIIAGTAETYRLQVSDLQGLNFYDKTLNLPAGEMVVDINVQSLLPRFYVLKIRNSRNEVVATQKI